MLLVHLEDPSPRARYVVRHVLGTMLGMEHAFADGLEEFRSAGGPKLHYGTIDPGGEVQHVPASRGGLALVEMPDRVTPLQGTPCIYLAAGRHDLFASVFRLLSLVDEHSPTARDRHGRVPAHSLFTVRHGLADAPWADQWALQLRDELEARWPGLAHGRNYRHLATVDLDNVLRYAGRPLLRTAAATGKALLHGQFSAAVERWRVVAGQRDPFLAALDLVEEQLPLVDEAILFLLLRGNEGYDHAVPPEKWPASARARIKALPTHVHWGLHPSYATRELPQRWAGEVEQFKRLGHAPLASRHHFLRWEVPATLRAAEAFGFTREHSLGFSDRAGFRASTCTPFPWYDLEQERESPLVLHPFAAMDSALIAQGKGPAAVEKAMIAMSDKVRAVGGTFISVWHDRYLSGHREFGPWPDIFRRVLRHARA